MLPTEVDLRETYNASRNTIRDAVKRLAAMGLVETRPGQGTFVTRPVEPFITTLTADPRSGFGGGEGAKIPGSIPGFHRAPSATAPKVEVRVPPEPIRLRLRIQEGEMVVSRHQERYIDDVPWSLETSFYPMAFVTAGATDLLMASDIAQGTVAYLAEQLDHRQTSYRDWITARRADENEQRFFRVGYEATVFEIFRTGYDQQGAPMRVTVSVFSADQNQFVYNVGDPPDPQ
jgi:GntR family transcriptional regulator